MNRCIQHKYYCTTNFLLQGQKLKVILFVTLFNLKDSKPSLKFAKSNLGKALFRAISKVLVIHP